jgi:hypothetical protein
LALLGQGRYAEAKGAFVRSRAILPEKHALRTIVSDGIQACERFLKLEERLPRLLRCEEKANSAGESLDLAMMCRLKGLYAAGARFSAEAFAADPKLASNPQTQSRYNAACLATLAAAGQGEDAAKLDDAAKVKLRGQTLDWLKAELTVWSRLLASGSLQTRPFIARTLSHWQNDPNLASIRDAKTLAKLPAEEQKAFTQLWADVAELLRKTEEKAK